MEIQQDTTLQLSIYIKPHSTGLMPQPFAWVDIPEGKVRLREGGHVRKGTPQRFAVSSFQISKYPITNAQFNKFIKAGGYDNRLWWTEVGWTLREKNEWTEPRYWRDQLFRGDEKPVVGVSWYECIAFCRWLSLTTDEKINLPTEQQWQWAAQGDKDLTYPWGNEWQIGRCNSIGPFESHTTTSVRWYAGIEKGDSPYKVTDMAGNVWEWCLTDYNYGNKDVSIEKAQRVLRGGSWYEVNPESFHTSNRYWDNPDDRYYTIGFRCVRS